MNESKLTDSEGSVVNAYTNELDTAVLVRVER